MSQKDSFKLGRVKARKTKKRSAVVRRKAIEGGGDPDSRLGLRMKHQRTLRRLTLKKLAEVAGCSESLLSRIENGNANPSVKTMHRVALALNVPVSALFQGDYDAENIVLHQGERPTARAGHKKGHKLEILIPARKGNLLSGYINDIEPGSGSEGTLSHAGEEFGYMLEGQLELTIEKRKYHLRPGDSFYFRSEKRHSYVNKWTKVARVLWLNTPPTF